MIINAVDMPRRDAALFALYVARIGHAGTYILAARVGYLFSLWIMLNTDAAHKVH